MAERSTAVIGAGWAGLAAAVEATRLGDRVTLFEMAPSLGGRARDVDVEGLALDNGQHICIGAYTHTLRLMQDLGVAEHEAFVRLPLGLIEPDGSGLSLRAGRPIPALVLGVLRHSGWRLTSRLALLRIAAGWSLSGFDCEPSTTVAELAAGLPEEVRSGLIEPLCVAALNTRSTTASGQVFLHVLHDALLSGSGSSDLLLPRVGLGALLPAPAARALQSAGATMRCAHRVESLAASERRWLVDGESFEQVVVAASAVEAARLIGPIDAVWAGQAAALGYEPIVTVYLQSEGTVLPQPMLMLRDGPERPAQFVFDRGQLGGRSGLLAFVISGAAEWVRRGNDDTLRATLAQAALALGAELQGPLKCVKLITEKRATFACTPALQRPRFDVRLGLNVAGDYVAGPYPSTLEGAVRSGLHAARAFERQRELTA